MKLSTGLGVMMFVAALGCALWASGPSAAADEIGAAAAVVSATVGSGEEHEYVGAKSCRKCHSATFKSWDQSAHAKAFDALKPGNAAEEKTKHNLDPAKDYTTDTSCLACHATGFGKPGGYAVPDPADEKAVKAAEKHAAVGCESCHGPGGSLEDLKKEIMKDKRKYKTEELVAKGLVVPTAETCQKCHTEDHPTFDAEDKFDYEKMKETGVHEHEELKLKEG